MIFSTVSIDGRQLRIHPDLGDRRHLDDVLVDLLRGRDVQYLDDPSNGLRCLELLDRGNFHDLLYGLDGRQLRLLRDLGDRRHIDDLLVDLFHGLHVQYPADLPPGLRHLELLDRGNFHDLLDGLDGRRIPVLRDPTDRRHFEDPSHGLDVRRLGILLHGLDLRHLGLLDPGHLSRPSR